MQEIPFDTALEIFTLDYIPDGCNGVVVTRNAEGHINRVMTTRQGFNHAYSLVRELDSLVCDLSDYSIHPPRSVAVHMMSERIRSIRQELLSFSKCRMVAYARLCMAKYFNSSMKAETELQERLHCAVDGVTWYPF